MRLEKYRADWAGAKFDVVGADPVPNSFSDADFVAVTMLSMSISWTRRRGITPRRILSLRQMEEKTAALLGDVDARKELHTLTHDEYVKVFGPNGTVRELFNLLASELKLGEVAAHKLLARKRPRLVPIRDSKAEKVLGRPDSWWQSWHEAVRTPEVMATLKFLNGLPGNAHLSLLRVADIVVWMNGRL